MDILIRGRDRLSYDVGFYGTFFCVLPIIEIGRERSDVQDGIEFCCFGAFQDDRLVCVDPLADIMCFSVGVVGEILVENSTVALEDIGLVCV